MWGYIYIYSIYIYILYAQTYTHMTILWVAVLRCVHDEGTYVYVWIFFKLTIYKELSLKRRTVARTKLKKNGSKEKTNIE